VLGSVKSLADRAALALENALLLKEKEAQLQELSEIHSRLMKLEQLKTDMIRIAAHDLRNPLGSIIGFGQLMMEEKERLEPDHVDFLEMINRSASKMQKIIEDILSLERIEEMQKGTFTNRIDLTEIIRSSVADMGIRALSKHQHLTLDMGDMPVLVSGDEPQIREAADNLIGNAIKYTPEQGQIVVSLRTINDRAVFEVEDNGIGIPEAQQSKLFSPFFRAKTEETQDIEGTGLGLHLVKNIIERHHGRMRFSSTYGKGSMFGFEMPIAR
jgi:signal transduction histidine kinase